MKKNKCSCPNDRLGRVGGQAVIEGVMMKAGKSMATTCRKEDGTITVSVSDFVSVRSRHKILDLPIIRGVVNFIEMMALSVKTLSISADALGIEEEDGKIEKWLKRHFGIRFTDVIMAIALVLGLALSVFLFMFLPTAVADLVNYLVAGKLGAWRAAVEGVAKIAIFIAYLMLVSLMPDIKRTFMYHGAEHKSIACYEAGDELTPENAKRHVRFHPRCGTSFMFFMILLGVFIGFFVRKILPGLDTLAYTGIRLLLLPLLMGLGYEIIRFAGKHDNVFTRILSAPGLWVQRITTKEPDEGMLEVAIISLKCALRSEVPEFMEFYNAAPWNSDLDTKETACDEEVACDKEVVCDEGAACNTDAPAEATEAVENTDADFTENTDTENANSIENATSAENANEAAAEGEK